MGLLSRIFGSERRTVVKLSDPYLAEVFAVKGTGNVTPDAVLSNLAVAARCVALRSEMLASVGLFLFRRSADGGRERADDNPLYGVLHDLANPNLTAFEAREFLIRSLDLAGNAYARIERNARGQVVALYPLAPFTVGVERLPSGRLRYRVSDDRGGTMVMLSDEILHIRGPSRDGVMGLSPITIARGALGLAIAQRETSKNLLSNALRPGGIMSFPQELSPEQGARLRVGLEKRFGGTDNAGRVMIMDGGAKFEHLSWSPEDAELLDTVRLSNEDVARVFGVPPTSVGILDRGTYSNVEQEARSLVQNCLGPLAKRVEAALSRCLLTDPGRRALYVEHDLDTLMRGDIKTRYEAYRLGREVGALSPNDIRRRENDPPIEGGNAYHVPQNWSELVDSHMLNLK